MLPALYLEISNCVDVAALLGKTALCDSTSAVYRCQLQGKLLEILVCSYNTQRVLKELIDSTFTPKTLEHFACLKSTF